MSIITKNYTVEYVSIDTLSDFISFIDITDFVYSLDEFVLQSTGKISTAKITLNSEFGNFITDDNSDTTPIISQFDLIRITILDNDGTSSEDTSKIFEVATDLSQNQGRSSYLLPLELEGRERNLSGIPFGGFFRSATHDEMVTSIRSAYNGQIKTFQPSLLEADDTDIPDFNPNIWDFTHVDNCYDALLAVLDSLDLPVSAGGGGNRYAMIFEDVYTTYPGTPSLGFFNIKIIIQGSNNTTIPTLEQNTTNPIMKIDRIKHASTGSLVVARGRPKTGTLPSNYSQFISKIEFYQNIRIWSATITYPVGSYVTFGANAGGWPQRYQANTENIDDEPPGTSWDTITVGDFVGDLQYSPFTEDKATPLKNGFANPSGSTAATSGVGLGIPDHNLVINDVQGDGDDKIGTYRNWALFRTNTSVAADQPTGAVEYLFSSNFYNGMVVLVDSNVGTLAGDFSGSDSNGVAFANNLAIWVAIPNTFISIPNGEWIVIRETEDFDQCAVYNEGIVYEYNVNFPKTQGDTAYPGADRRRGGTETVFEWRDISNVFMGNDCFHNPTSVTNVTGLVASTLSNGEPLTNTNQEGTPAYNETSGVQIIFGYNQVNETQEERDVWFKMIKTIVSAVSATAPITTFLANLASEVYDTFTTPQYTNMGWWFAWPTPYPFSTVNTIDEAIGALYGGFNTTLNDHRYFDLFNIEHTTTGQQGWTQTDSADLSEITGVEFLFNYDITIGDTRIPFTGDIPFSYWCIDSNGTMWKSPKVMYRHLGETQQIKIELGDLSPVFRGRTPLGIDNVLENIIVGEIEVNEVFFKDKVIIQGFQCETPYDEFGRYSPNLFDQIIKPVFFDVFSGGSSEVEFIGIIDAFAFIKTPVAISDSTTLSTERTIIPQFEDFQNIVNTEQLQRFANSANDVAEFQYEQYTIEQGGAADLALEDSIYLSDPYMISESDSGSDNTRLLAIREIHYSVPPDSGLLRKLVATKVIDV